MSGHNKWSSIKHRKGAQDAKRGKLFTKLIKEITIAARLGGGDPDGNPRLRKAIDEARTANMPNDNITRAIKKGTGELEGLSYEEMTYEAVGPAGALILLDVVTDNRNRTAPELRKILDKHRGELGGSGSAAWAFEQKGIVRVPLESVGEEKLVELAASAGAEDVHASGDEWVVTTPREELDTVASAVQQAGITVRSAELDQLPNTQRVVDEDDARVLLELLEELEDHDDVQRVYSDFEPSQELLSQLSDS